MGLGMLRAVSNESHSREDDVGAVVGTILEAYEMVSYPSRACPTNTATSILTYLCPQLASGVLVAGGNGAIDHYDNSQLNWSKYCELQTEKILINCLSINYTTEGFFHDLSLCFCLSKAHAFPLNDGACF